MNFRITEGHKSDIVSFGKVLYESNNILIESDFQKTLVSKKSKHVVICLGFVRCKDKTKDVKTLLDFINEETFVGVSNELEGRYVLLLVYENDIYISSDRFGKLDVFYQRNNNNISLASNLDLLPEDPAKNGFNEFALVHTLTYYGHRPAKKDTIYNSVKRLGVDEVAHITKGKLTLLKNKFALQKTAKFEKNKHEEYANIFLENLKDLSSENGNLVYLSSGWDSTAILAGLVHTVGNDKVECLIGKMKYSVRSGCCNQIEIDKAKKFAKHYNVKLNVVDFDITEKDEEYFRLLKEKMRKHQLYTLTGLTHDKLAIKASELLKKNEMIFAGEISDGAHNLGFSQYATTFHPSFGYREYSDKMCSYLFGPTFLSLLINGKYIDDPIYKLFKSQFNSNTIFDEVKQTPEDIKLQLLTSFFLRNSRIPLISLDDNNLLTSQGAEDYTLYMQKSYLSDIAKNMDFDNIYASYLYLYNSFHWQGSTVHSLQTLADYYSLNTHLPFWNSRLQNFLAQMPEDWGRGLDLNPTKFPLKQMLKDKINYPYDFQEGPHSYTYDVDHSFNHAQEVYCYSALVEDFQESVKNKPYHQILSKDFFDLDYIDGLVEEYIVSPKNMHVSRLNELAPLIMLCYIGWYGKK